MTETIVIYHANCLDGFGAAWAVREYFGRDNSAVSYYAATYQQDPPDVTGKHVIIVDFSYKRPVILEMAKTAKTILIIDHHKTALEDIGDFPMAKGGYVTDITEMMEGYNIRAVFNMERSGCVLAWEYFHPRNTTPNLLKFIEDRDLWTFEYPSTKSICAALYSYDFDFIRWDLLMDDVGRLQNEGKGIQRQHDKTVKALAKTAYTICLDGHRVPAVNANMHYASDLGHALSKQYLFAVVYIIKGDTIKFSLRSNNSGFDVSKVAAKFGGGGHKAAAGFETDDFSLIEPVG